MKKQIKWIIGIICIILITLCIVAIINEMKFHYKIEEIMEINYNILEQKGKYGIIDKKGNIIIEPQYAAIQIPNPSKPIFICIESYNADTKEYKTKVLNEKNEMLFSKYENIQAISIETNIDKNPYEKSVLCYKENGKYGLISIKGKRITKPIYDEISSVSNKEGTFFIKKDSKVGVINQKGKIIIKPIYETITSDNYCNENTKNEKSGFIVGNKTQEGYRYGYINYRGKIILSPQYTELERVTNIASEKEIYFIAFKDGQAGLLKNKTQILPYEYEDIQYTSLNDVFIVQRNSNKGVVNKEGKVIINSEYDNILFGGMYINAKKNNKLYLFDFNGNSIQKKQFVNKNSTDNPKYYIGIDQNDIYSIIDQNDNVIVDNNYTYIEYLPGDYFIVSKDGKNGIIDSKGMKIVDLNYTSIFRLGNTNMIQAEIFERNEEKLENNVTELYSLNMKKIIGMENGKVEVKDKYILIASNKDFEYYDFNGNKLKAKDIFKENKLFAKKIGDKWGFVDKNDDMIIEANYDMVTDFNENGFAGINKDGKWGVIEQSTQKIIQEPIYKLDWIQPNFLGKYYQINAWYVGVKYSDDIKEIGENKNE